jgi:hypothetical protein
MANVHQRYFVIPAKVLAGIYFPTFPYSYFQTGVIGNVRKPGFRLATP